MNFAQSLGGFIKLSKHQYLDFKRMPQGPGLILPTPRAHPGARAHTANAQASSSFMADAGVGSHPYGKWNTAVERESENLGSVLRCVICCATLGRSLNTSGPPLTPW